MQSRNALLCYCVIVLALIFPSLSIAANKNISTNHSWMFSVGLFSGPYDAYFHHEAILDAVGVNAGAQQMFDTDVLQTGIHWGGQVMTQYYFNPVYFLGVSVGAMGTTNKALLTQLVDDNESPTANAFDIHHQFRMDYNVDTSVFFGRDITPQTHAYVKGGASFARFTHRVMTTQGRFYFAPIPVLQQTQHKNLWGFVWGLGMVRDLNAWISAFIEYNYYAYGSHALNTLFDLAPFYDGNRSTFTQRIHIHASALHLGLNLNLGGHFYPAHDLAILHPWMFFIGGFAGYYSAPYQYGANIFSVNAQGPSNEAFNDHVFQQGVLGGGQFGMQYHFAAPFSFGAAFSATSIANKAYLTEHVQNTAGAVVGGAFDVLNQFRIYSNQDLAGLVGVDLTPQTHLHVKIGASLGRFVHYFATILGQGSTGSMPSLQQTQHQNIWGWILGFDLTRDLNRWVSAFAEYSWYDYGTRELQAFNNITPNILATGVDRFTEHVNIHASAVRVGLNLNFGSYFFPMRDASPMGWLIYTGMWGGYYAADFRYGSTYFSSPDTQTFNNDAWQLGATSGAQVGIQYHFVSPYSLGLALSGMMNFNKARVTELVENAIDPGFQGFTLTHQFYINRNFDMAVLWGMDITNKTHGYVKGGVSCARFNDRLIIQQTVPAFSQTPFTRLLTHRNFWGWMAGLGFDYDLSRWVSVFTEYDFYDYTNRNLTTLTSNLSPSAGGEIISPEVLTQHLAIAAFSARVGFNLKFAI